VLRYESLIPVYPLTVYMERDVADLIEGNEEPTVEDSAFGEVPERVLTENMKEALNGGNN